MEDAEMLADVRAYDAAKTRLEEEVGGCARCRMGTIGI